MNLTPATKRTLIYAGASIVLALIGLAALDIAVGDGAVAGAIVGLLVDAVGAVLSTE